MDGMGNSKRSKLRFVKIRFSENPIGWAGLRGNFWRVNSWIVVKPSAMLEFWIFSHVGLVFTWEISRESNNHRWRHRSLKDGEISFLCRQVERRNNSVGTRKQHTWGRKIPRTLVRALLLVWPSGNAWPSVCFWCNDFLLLKEDFKIVLAILDTINCCGSDMFRWFQKRCFSLKMKCIKRNGRQKPQCPI